MKRGPGRSRRRPGGGDDDGWALGLSGIEREVGSSRVGEGRVERVCGVLRVGKLGQSGDAISGGRVGLDRRDCRQDDGRKREGRTSGHKREELPLRV